MKRAFSLVEILVIIAIVALIAALIFPVFAQAKRSANTTACISNLRQMGLAVQMYQADANEMLPCGEVLRWVNKLPDGTSVKGSTRDMIKPLERYAAGNAVMHCGENHAIFLPRWVKRFSPVLKESRLMMPTPETVLVCCIHHLTEGFSYGSGWEQESFPRNGIELVLRVDGSVGKVQGDAVHTFQFRSEGGQDVWTDEGSENTAGFEDPSFLVYPNETWPPQWLKLPENPEINWGRGS